jgi:hypothetical protein
LLASIFLFFLALRLVRKATFFSSFFSSLDEELEVSDPSDESDESEVSDLFLWPLFWHLFDFMAVRKTWSVAWAKLRLSA